MDAQVEIPTPIAGSHPLPAAVEKKWKEAWLVAYSQAREDEPEGKEVRWRHAANRAANKTLRFADPTNFEEAMALESWKVIRREEEDTVAGRMLKIVTRHGRGHAFPVPKNP
jgi:hypothetical protein